VTNIMVNLAKVSRRLLFICTDVYLGELKKVTAERMEHDMNRLLASVVQSPADGPGLSYIFIRGQLCLLTGHGPVFSPVTIAGFEHDLRDVMVMEPERALNSTPQLRLFVKGSFREWGKDDVPKGLHYVVTISTPPGLKSQLPTIDIGPEKSHLGEVAHETSRIASIDLMPGRVIVHSTTLQYRINIENLSSDPAEGLAIVDGYIW
jgi:hypothetical protein